MKIALEDNKSTENKIAKKNKKRQKNSKYLINGKIFTDADVNVFDKDVQYKLDTKQITKDQ